MKKIIPLMFVLACSQSYAVTVDVNIGASRYVNGSNGLWYVDGFDHKESMNAPSIDIGVTESLFEKDDIGLDLREGLIYIGGMNVSARVPSHHTNTNGGTWVGPDFVGANQQNPCHGACNDLSTFNGSGHEIGVTLTVSPYIKRNGYKFSAIAGIIAHRTTFTENVTHLDWSSNSTFYDTSVSTATKIRAGSILGAAVEHKNIIYKYQYINTPPNNTGLYPPAWHAVHMISIGYQF